MSQQKDEELAQDVITLEKFASYTTLHGFQFTTRGNHPIRRMVWTLLILTFLGCFVVEVYRSAVKLSKHGITYSYNTEYEENLTFPAVSICNINMLKKRKILGKDAQAFLDSINGVIPEINKTRYANKTFNLEEAIVENGHQLKDMLVMCTWSLQKNCSEDDFTIFYSTERGLCYTFNSGQKEPALSVSGTGPQNGLVLSLNAQPDEYYGYYSYESYGFKVIVHDQGEIPLPVDVYGSTCSAGHTLELSVSKHKIIRLGKTPAKNCEDKDGYSEKMCMINCNRKMIAENCGCTQPFKTTAEDDYFSKVPICNPVNKTVIKCVNINYLQKAIKCKNKCLPKCDEVVYMKSSSVSLYPSSYFWSDVQKYKDLNPMLNQSFGKFVHTGKNTLPLARVKVFYETMEVKSREELRAYDIEDFFGDLGGFLGLCLGCSILTLGEVVDAIVSWCLMSRRNKNRVVDFKK